MQYDPNQDAQWPAADSAQGMAPLRVVSQPVVSGGSMPAVRGVAGVGLPAQVSWGARSQATPPAQMPWGARSQATPPAQVPWGARFQATPPAQAPWGARAPAAPPAQAPWGARAQATPPVQWRRRPQWPGGGWR